MVFKIQCSIVKLTTQRGKKRTRKIHEDNLRCFSTSQLSGTGRQKTNLAYDSINLPTFKLQRGPWSKHQMGSSPPSLNNSSLRFQFGHEITNLAKKIFIFISKRLSLLQNEDIYQSKYSNWTFWNYSWQASKLILQDAKYTEIDSKNKFTTLQNKYKKWWVIILSFWA